MSNINPNSINITFPVAGQDNNSQGFRDNFANTATNFTFAAAEITDLQNKALLKSALTGGTLNNNLQGALLTNAVISGFADLILDLGAVSGAVSINATTASFQRITTSGAVTISLAGFPAAGNYGKLRLEVVVTNIAHTLTIPASVSLGTTGINGLSGTVITFPSVGNYLYEFSTFDGGGSFFILDMLQSRTALTGNLNVTGNISATGSITGGSNVNVNANATPLSSQPAALTGTLLRLVNADGSGCRALIEAYNSLGQTPGVSNRFARGTSAAPTATQSADLIGTFTGHGYGVTGFGTASTGLVGFVAEGAFTDSSMPTAVTFQVTPSASITKAEKMRLSSAGVLTVTGGVASTSTTTGTVVVTGGIGAAGAIAGQYFIENVVSKTGAYNTVTTDSVVLCNATSGAFSVQLHTPVGFVGKVMHITKTDLTGNNITVTTAAGAINGITSLTGGAYTTNTLRATYISDGTNWNQIA